MKRVLCFVVLAIAAVVRLSPSRAGEALSGDQPKSLIAMPNIAGDAALRSWGTGFVVDRDGHILTARHNVADCDRIDVVGRAGRVAATIEALSPTDDLGLLHAHVSGDPILFDAGERLRAGSFVTILSYPILEAARGRLGAGQLQFNGVLLGEGPPRHIAVVSDSRPGSSGSPVMSDTGAVIGILVSELSRADLAAATAWPRDIRLAIDGSTAQQFLRLHGVADAEMPASHATPLERLAAAEVQVECRGK